MLPLLLSLAFVGQSGGSGLYDGGQEIPATVYFTNPHSGSSRVPLTFTKGVGWVGSDGNGTYKLGAGAFVVSGQAFAAGYSFTITYQGATGNIDMKRNNGATWGLSGFGMSIDGM